MKIFIDIDQRRERMIKLNKSRSVPVEDRLWPRAELREECFLWTGTKNQAGYGSIQVAGKKRLVHRIAYMETAGEIPEGLELDHLCRNRACINPMHLEPVSAGENMERVPYQLKTHCKYGHELTRNETGLARCRRCRADLVYKGIKKRYKYSCEEKSVSHFTNGKSD